MNKLLVLYNPNGKTYEVYAESRGGVLYFNMVPEGRPTPSAGYKDLRWLLRHKGFHDPRLESALRLFAGQVCEDFDPMGDS